jgi:lactoylglutathione lyase
MLNLVVIRARDVERLGVFYNALGVAFAKHRHGNGPEHLSGNLGETVFEIYPAKEHESTSLTRLGFSVPSLTRAIDDLRRLNATIITEPCDTEFGRRAVVKDFEGHRVEIYEAK